MHPHVTGYRSRIWILEKLLEEITRRSDVWIATHAEIAAFVKAECP
jgi:peptidoglycan-N-acetylglucosamine deacetylase